MQMAQQDSGGGCCYLRVRVIQRCGRLQEKDLHDDSTVVRSSIPRAGFIDQRCQAFSSHRRRQPALQLFRIEDRITSIRSRSPACDLGKMSVGVRRINTGAAIRIEQRPRTIKYKWPIQCLLLRSHASYTASFLRKEEKTAKLSSIQFDPIRRSSECCTVFPNGPSIGK